MKSSKYLTIGDFAGILLILILKAFSIVLKSCLCINKKVDIKKFKDNLLFLNKNQCFLIRYVNSNWQ